MTVIQPKTRIDFAANLHYSRLLSGVPGIRHAITRRIEGAGIADANVGFSAPRDIDDAWTMRQHWASAAGFDPHTIVTTRQVHGRTVLHVRASDAGRGGIPGSAPLAEGDAVITDEPGVTLFSLHADCQIILLADPDHRAIGAIHAGWRGTTIDIAGAAVVAMAVAFGSRPERLVAYVGPAIGGCCYEVGDEVIETWTTLGMSPESASRVGPRGKRHFDLTAANTLLLLRAGMLPERIEQTTICTKCDSANWFSHRAQGAKTGRFAGMIAVDDGAR